MTAENLQEEKLKWRVLVSSGELEGAKGWHFAVYLNGRCRGPQLHDAAMGFAPTRQEAIDAAAEILKNTHSATSLFPPKEGIPA